MSEKRFKVLDMVAEARERLNIFVAHRDHMIDTDAIQQYVEWSDGAVTDTERELDSLLPLAEVAEAVAALEAARPAHTAGRVDSHAEAMRNLAERVEKLEADNAKLRADLDAANRRWDAWAQAVQPDMLKVSQLDTERRLAEVERRVEGLPPRENLPDCGLCGGTGVIHLLSTGPSLNAYWTTTVCGGCKGTGKYIEQPQEGQG